MSVKIMGQVWDLNNDQISREEKYILLAYADHADHDGNNMYPSIETICKKTGYKERSVQLITRSLEKKGYLLPDGSGKNGTNKWSFGGGAKFAGVQSTTRRGANRKGRGVQPVAPEPLTIIKPSVELTEQEKEQAGQQIVSYLAMSQFPGAKREVRISSIQSYLAERLHINTENKRWLAFSKFVDDRQMNFGEQCEIFIGWLISQDGYKPQFWPPDRMQEFWPMAFTKQKATGRPTEFI